MLRTFGVIGLAVCATAASALAQSHVSQAQFTVDQWTYTPTYKQTAAGVRVDSVLAIRDPLGATGQNIVAVWYVRPATGCTAWVAKAWESADQWEAIKHVKSELSIPDSEDGLWGTFTDKPATIATNPGVDYEKGFVSTDPLGTALTNDPTRDWVIEILAAAGYKVADNPLDKAPPDGCKADDWLCAMAVSAEQANTAGFIGDWGNQFFAIGAACAAYAAAPPMHTAVGPWGGWTWGTWTPYTLDRSNATTCFYRRTLVHSNCRTITYPPGTVPLTKTQCVYQYCQEECSLPINPDGTCPPPCAVGTVGTPIAPLYPTPVGPSPGLPYIPRGTHPTTQPDCLNGGTKPW